MESLNMSKLNLSSASSQSVNDSAPVAETSDVKLVTKALLEMDEDYYCEYREDIWKNLLEKEADKPQIHLQSPQLEFRGALVQELRSCVRRLHLGTHTLHAAVALLDLFMDAHQLREDRLTDVALAALSLAAKSEEKFSPESTLKCLSRVSNVQLSASTFRQLEWMVGQHVRWRLLVATPVTFAALLAHVVVTDADLTTRHPKFVRRFRRAGMKLLDAYLDLTLSDVRLKVIESVDVGCACVACARADLGLAAWPGWLAETARRPAAKVAPVARLLQRMMRILKESEVDQGYGSARTSPSLTPCASPRLPASPATTASGSSDRHASDFRHPILSDQPTVDYSASMNTGLEKLMTNRFVATAVESVPNALDYYNRATSTSQPYNLGGGGGRVPDGGDYKYSRARRLVEASLEVLGSDVPAQMAVKRGSSETNIELARKRYCPTAQIVSQGLA